MSIVSIPAIEAAIRAQDEHAEKGRVCAMEMAILAALSHMGEPVAWQRRTASFGWTPVAKEDIAHYRSVGQEIRSLFAGPTASAIPEGWKLVPSK